MDDCFFASLTCVPSGMYSPSMKQPPAGADLCIPFGPGGTSLRASLMTPFMYWACATEDCQQMHSAIQDFTYPTKTRLRA